MRYPRIPIGKTRRLAAINGFSLIAASMLWLSSCFFHRYLFYNIFPFNSYTHAFMSVVPSVWHIFVRVCCVTTFSSVFYRYGFYRQAIWPLCRTEEMLFVHIGLFVCPPWYLMSYWGVGCIIQVCNMSVVVLRPWLVGLFYIGVTALLRLGFFDDAVLG